MRSASDRYKSASSSNMVACANGWPLVNFSRHRHGSNPAKVKNAAVRKESEIRSAPPKRFNVFLMARCKPARGAASAALSHSGAAQDRIGRRSRAAQAGDETADRRDFDLRRGRSDRRRCPRSGAASGSNARTKVCARTACRGLCGRCGREIVPGCCARSWRHQGTEKAMTSVRPCLVK